MAIKKEYIRYSDEQLSNLRRTDMVDFLSSKYGYSFRQEGNSFRCREHDSLVVDENRTRWYWNSRGVGGNNVIDWFGSIEGIDFQECCRIMLGNSGAYTPTIRPAPPKPKEEKKPFEAPKCHEGSKYSRVYTYLTKTRCISPKIVKRMFDLKKIYQEAKFGNCVFAGYDENGVMRFAERRSTSTYKRYDAKTGKEIRFRPTVESSDYRYGFYLDSELPSRASDRLYIFEAPIDLLSHCTLTNIKAKNDEAYKLYNRISLSGVSDIALEYYLEKHKDIKKLIFCVDNDEGGRKIYSRLAPKYTELKYECVYAPVSFGKDYNDLLCEVVRRMNNTKHQFDSSRLSEEDEEEVTQTKSL